MGKPEVLNLTFKVNVNNPQINKDLNQVIVHVQFKFVDPGVDKLKIGEFGF